MPLHKRIKFLIEYAFFTLGAGVLRVLPWSASIALGRALGRAASYLVWKRFNLTTDNISRAFPSKTRAEVLDIARKSWENIGVTAAECAHAASMNREELLGICAVSNSAEFEKHIATGRGAIVHLAHLANWEIAGLGVHAKYGNVAAVARRIRNPYVDAWMERARQHSGMQIISHKNPFFSCAKWLKKGRILGILMDQNMPYGEVFLPFFGRMASTTPLTALLALKTGLPIFPVRISRENGKIVANFEDPIYPEEGYSDETVYRLIQQLNARIEAWVRQNPHDWLWAHNRWKREGQAPLAAEPAGAR
ncbi:MAG: lysophospholipid acyltransferase family protein [Elusimicrobia bacterium]|nr:lysophospholipid acyltransferase family protein [Elusimicrobiota bacterium]